MDSQFTPSSFPNQLTMKTHASLILALVAISNLHAALPTDEAGAIAYLTEKGVTITKNAEGHAASLKAPGKPALTAEEYALIGQLTSLEQMGMDGAPLADGEWAFLKSLPKLKQLAIYHSAGFGSLEPFSGLPVESLTIGGCVGLRNLNRSDKAKLRDALTTLHDLPNLTKGSWYHSPLAPDDTHLAHIAAQFPKLTDLRLDFDATAGTQTSITPAGLAALQKLPLTVLRVESVQSFTAEHFQAIAGIKTLRTLTVDSRKTLTTLTVDSRKQPANEAAIAAFKQARPDVEVAVSQPGDKFPPQVKKK